MEFLVGQLDGDFLGIGLEAGLFAGLLGEEERDAFIEGFLVGLGETLAQLGEGGVFLAERAPSGGTGGKEGYELAADDAFEKGETHADIRGLTLVGVELGLGIFGAEGGDIFERGAEGGAGGEFAVGEKFFGGIEADRLLEFFVSDENERFVFPAHGREPERADNEQRGEFGVVFFVARFAGHPEEGFFGEDEERLFAAAFLDGNGFEFR